MARLKQGMAAAAADELKALRHELSRLRRERVSGAEGDVRAAFARFDANRSGRLDHRALRAALGALQLDASTTEAAALLSRLDRERERSGQGVELGEFAELVGQLRRAAATAAAGGGVGVPSHQGVAALTQALAARDGEIAQLKRALQSHGQLAHSSVSHEVQQAFGRFDTHRSGRLDVRELHAALQAVGLDASSGGAAALVAQHERGRAAALELVEFSTLVEQLRAMQRSTAAAELAALRGELGAKERELKALRRELEAARAALGQSRRVPDDVRAAFERFDANRNGKLDFRELRAALAAAGLDASSAEAAQLIGRHDRDGSGLMELAEFSDLVGALRRAQSQAMASELGSLRAQLAKPPSPSLRGGVR